MTIIPHHEVIIFGKIANLSTDGIPHFLFYLSGGVFWSYFAKCLAIGRSVFLTNRDLYSQVYIPKLAVPIANNIGEFLKLIVQILLFISFFIYFYANGIDLNPSISLIFLIPLLFFQFVIIKSGENSLNKDNFSLILSSGDIKTGIASILQQENNNSTISLNSSNIIPTF